MSISTDSIEVAAASIDEAISQALERLQAEQDDVAIEVLSTPRSGLLGLGVRQARVRVTRRSPEAASSGVTSPPPAPPPKPRSSTGSRAPAQPSVKPASVVSAPRSAVTPIPERPGERPMPQEEEEHVEELIEETEKPESDKPENEGNADARSAVEPRAQVAEGAELLGKILELMGEKAAIETVCDDDPEMLELNIKGDGSGLLIGRHGQTLDALEYVVNRILARRIREAAPISIDTESYRARRRGQLHRMALSKGEEAKREHQAVTLEPMPPRDRRIVHLALKDDPLVTTRSAGEGFLRAIQIVPIDGRRDSSGNPGSRDRPRGRGGPRDRENPPPGQQGGFQHGQKRIV
jgi:spoIIIJ-associated protein